MGSKKRRQQTEKVVKTDLNKCYKEEQISSYCKTQGKISGKTIAG